MRNPRSTFNLTSIQSQHSGSQSRRRCSPQFSKTKMIGSIPDQENRLKKQVHEFSIKNQKLAEFIHHFENSTTDLNERDNLIKDLQVALIKHTSSLEKRLKRISDLENQVLIFRSVSNDEKKFECQFPIRLPDESCRTNSARTNRRKLDFSPRPKYQKPKRRIFPPPKIDKNPENLTSKTLSYISTIPSIKNADDGQVNIHKERENLIQKSLYLDRLISIEKLKLKLWHDNQKLSELKNDLDLIQSDTINFTSFRENENEEENLNEDLSEIKNMTNDFSDNENENDDLSDIKNSINIIKDRIQKEKDRIQFYENEYFQVIDAAITIQKFWRGYSFRKSQKINGNN